jgi:hypothetical protein
MSVRKICRPKGCRGSPRCDHPWWFDVMYGGKRWRMRVDEFSLVRGATEPVTSKQVAERVWEPKFLGEIMAGTRDVLPAGRDAADPEPACGLGQHQIVIPGANAKDAENRRIPFDPQGRLAPILKRRAALGLGAFVFGLPEGELQDSFKTAWESLLLLAYGHEMKRVKPGARVDREKLRQIDLHWHDLRHEGACRLLADGVDIRIIQLMLGHSDIKTTQRYLNITDEELRKVLTGVWERRRQLKAVGE